MMKTVRNFIFARTAFAIYVKVMTVAYLIKLQMSTTAKFSKDTI